MSAPAHYNPDPKFGLRVNPWRFIAGTTDAFEIVWLRNVGNSWLSSGTEVRVARQSVLKDDDYTYQGTAE